MPSRPSIALALLAGCTYLGPSSLDRDEDGVLDYEDCDFTSPAAGSRATLVQAWVDLDGDGFGSGTPEEVCGAPPPGSVERGGDCDDEDPLVHPAGVETCATPGVDDDCNGLIDDNDQDFLGGLPLLPDLDEDGFVDGTIPLEQAELACTPRFSLRLYTGGARDCDDQDPAIHPDMPEQCDGIDQDCDGDVDESLQFQTWYPDDDGDGFGGADEVFACVAPSPQHVLLGGDCDDGAAQVNPARPEVCNGADDDCDGQADQGLLFQDWFYDADGDFWGGSEHLFDCQQPTAAHVLLGGDCDDAAAHVNPGVQEVCNDVDDDCNGTVDDPDELAYFDWYLDGDGDGFGAGVAEMACAPPHQGFTLVAGDCDDAAHQVFPGAAEDCNSIDDDCDGHIDNDVLFQLWYPDVDHDGFGDDDQGQNTCNPPADAVFQGGDCNDGDPDTYLGALEHPYDGVDQDCNGSDLDDLDADGFVATQAGGADCDDGDAAVNPGADEIVWYDGVDQDCDGNDTDQDGDGEHAPPWGPDCNDTNPAFGTFAFDDPTDSHDADCDGFVKVACYLDADNDGFGTALVPAQLFDADACPPGLSTASNDCDDSDPDTRPDAVEVCDFHDANCDGDADQGLITVRYADGTAENVGSEVALSSADGVTGVDLCGTEDPLAPLALSLEIDVVAGSDTIEVRGDLARRLTTVAGGPLVQSFGAGELRLTDLVVSQATLTGPAFTLNEGDSVARVGFDAVDAPEGFRIGDDVELRTVVVTDSQIETLFVGGAQPDQEVQVDGLEVESSTTSLSQGIANLDVEGFTVLDVDSGGNEFISVTEQQTVIVRDLDVYGFSGYGLIGNDGNAVFVGARIAYADVDRDILRNGFDGATTIVDFDIVDVDSDQYVLENRGTMTLIEGDLRRNVAPQPTIFSSAVLLGQAVRFEDNQGGLAAHLYAGGQTTLVDSRFGRFSADTYGGVVVAVGASLELAGNTRVDYGYAMGTTHAAFTVQEGASLSQTGFLGDYGRLGALFDVAGYGIVTLGWVTSRGWEPAAPRFELAAYSLVDIFQLENRSAPVLAQVHESAELLMYGFCTVAPTTVEYGRFGGFQSQTDFPGSDTATCQLPILLYDILPGPGHFRFVDTSGDGTYCDATTPGTCYTP